jgi:hypothetical protein
MNDITSFHFSHVTHTLTLTPTMVTFVSREEVDADVEPHLTRAFACDILDAAEVVDRVYPCVGAVRLLDVCGLWSDTFSTDMLLLCLACAHERGVGGLIVPFSSTGHYYATFVHPGGEHWYAYNADRGMWGRLSSEEPLVYILMQMPGAPSIRFREEGASGVFLCEHNLGQLFKTYYKEGVSTGHVRYVEGDVTIA